MGCPIRHREQRRGEDPLGSLGEGGGGGAMTTRSPEGAPLWHSSRLSILLLRRLVPRGAAGPFSFLTVLLRINHFLEKPNADGQDEGGLARFLHRNQNQLSFYGLQGAQDGLDLREGGWMD